MAHVLRPGWNCDPLVKASRFALLVDGDAYFRALADCVSRAERTVALVGWDLDSRMRLEPAKAAAAGPSLQEFLCATVEAAPQLNVYILTWSFPLLFANEREPRLVMGQNPFNHPRLHFEFDSTHPPGASHHQKIVVIDDTIAFAGGMDLAGGRWDTPEHCANDSRRAGKDGRPYPPTHDVQALVDGEPARRLAAIVRDRWHRATGTSIPRHASNAEIWPDGVQPDLERVYIGISRTDLNGDGGESRYEIERLHLDLIDAAHRFMYIEEQYLTSDGIVTALCRRLEEDDGPEMLLVLPLRNWGWLEDRTIEVLRFRCIRRLHEADRFRRLRICYPVVPGLDGEAVQMHSKILVIDDRLFRVGSSNMTNRSMRLDSECDLTIEATSAQERHGVARLRNRLLAEHLGLSVNEVEAFLARTPSLVALVDSRRSEPRSLREFPPESDTVELLVDEELVDPSEPVTPSAAIESLSRSVLLTKWIVPAALACVAITLALWAIGSTLKATLSPATRRGVDGPMRLGPEGD